ncbi:YtzH-like family protein [Alkalihalobacillus sp. AL-G]|uniref:YtzH-like family protein n=1 Tax=Alkalihalobacillus sp. AL-G TaxID=2926399 RepID=UPI00272AAC87|nr:YtzH-like family protein [Alkalihalobacillus sp. AL-G]WLD92420.1 YtzH-like family protein [Alkalihalobacillus sp. AL-G]
MPLQTKDQLTLLADILRTHQLDQCGSQSECQQLERLTNSLLQNPSTPPELRETLSSIHTYSQQGNQAGSINGHIQGHQGHLMQWMTTLNS